MHLWNTYPTKKLTLVHGKGCTVWDTNGKAYLDLLAGTWCNILGYAHPRWVAEIQEQTPKFVHSIKASVSKETIEALDELSTILPPELNRAFFLNTGSEAVEAALSLITQVPSNIVGNAGATTVLAICRRSPCQKPDDDAVLCASTAACVRFLHSLFSRLAF